MNKLGFKVIDVDFPSGSSSKTATLLLGKNDAVLVDAAFTRADGHRIVSEVSDSGKNLTTIYLSYSDPDFYFGAEVVADAFPEAAVVAPSDVIETIKVNHKAKLQAWSDLGTNLPARLVDISPQDDGFTLEGYHFQPRGQREELPSRTYLWQPELKMIVGGVYLFEEDHVWVADTPQDQQILAWLDVLNEMTALEAAVVIPGHRQPNPSPELSAIANTFLYLTDIQNERRLATDGTDLTNRMLSLYPDYGLTISAQIGGPVLMGEKTWP